MASLELRAGMLECEQSCEERCSGISGRESYMRCVEECMRDCAIAKDKPMKL